VSIFANGESVAFYLISLCTIGCAVMMLSFRKVIYMALAMGGVFLGCAAVYLMLGAEFVGVAQIAIYAGAITILIMFAIMLTNHEAIEPEMKWSVRHIMAAVLSTGLALVLLLILRKTAWPTNPGTTDINNGLENPVAIGLTLFKNYTIPFELVSLLLLVALVGAVLLAQDRKEEE
jgi:NADH-quinone oxidoreductase subunit J